MMIKEFQLSIAQEIKNESLPRGLSQMAIANLNVLVGLLDTNLVSQAIAGQLAPENTILANEALIDYLYPTRLASIYRNRYGLDIHRYIKELEDSFRQGKEELLDSICELGIGMMIIRPEMMDFVGELEQFMGARGIEVFYRKAGLIDIDQYTVISEKGFRNPDGSYFDFATRTLNYIGHQSMILLLKSKNEINNYGLVDRLGVLKGMQKQLDDSTARGGPVFNCLTRVGCAKEKMPPGIALAVDPIMAYRHIVDGSVPAPPDHIHSTLPLMYYVGQGIHIPDSAELARDISVVFTKSELTNILTNSTF